MTQISVLPCFCTGCGAVIAHERSFCPSCGKKVDTRHGYPDDETISLSTRATDLSGNNQPQDPDATVRAGTRASSRLYEAAAKQYTALQTVKPETEKSDKEASLAQKHLSSMHARKTRSTKKSLVRLSCAAGVLLVVFLLVSGAFSYTKYTYTKQQAGQNKSHLDHLIQQAQSAGVPVASLQPILTQEQQVNAAYRLLTLFPNLFGSNIYQYQAQHYAQLQTQISGIITTATQQAQLQAQMDLQNFQSALSKANMQPIGNIQAFSQKFSQDQLLIASAHQPKDYAAISQDARQAIMALALLPATFQQLTDLNNTLLNLQTAHVDVTAMQTQYQNDLAQFNAATQSSDLQNLGSQIDAQYQQLLALSVKAFPYVSATELNELTEQVQTLRTYGLDSAIYQKRLDADQIAQARAVTLGDELAFCKQVNADIVSMHADLTKGNAHYLVKQFQQEVAAWAQVHPYHDNSDGHDYALDNGYMNMGIGSLLENNLEHAQAISDYTALITQVQNALFNLHAFEADATDQKPFDQIHATDQQMLDHYQLQKKQVLMVSLSEQAMRVYQNGNLQQSYHVTTGRQELPSLPGVWTILDRKTSVIFTSGEPKGSPYWFPDTPINYAILYHYGGYFIHDAPWRANFGPGTQFPHQDDSGTTSYNFDGSHGCINLAESAAAWVYNNTDWNTVIVIY